MPAIARAHSVTDIMSGSTNRAGATGTVSSVISGLYLKASHAHKYCRECLRCRQSDYFVGSLRMLYAYKAAAFSAVQLLTMLGFLRSYLLRV